MSLAEAVEIATLLAIVTGFALGIAQMRLANRQRQDQVAAEVYGLSLTTTHLLENHFEYWGSLVFQRVIDLHTLDRMIGGVVRASWRKLRPYVEHQRHEQNVPNMAEWFQWLADRLEAHPAPGKHEGAHVSYSDWRP